MDIKTKMLETIRAEFGDMCGRIVDADSLEHFDTKGATTIMIIHPDDPLAVVVSVSKLEQTVNNLDCIEDLILSRVRGARDLMKRTQGEAAPAASLETGIVR